MNKLISATVSAAVGLVAVVVFGLFGCSSREQDSVVVYASENQVFSEPILRDFERETGIRVKAVFDTKEAKNRGHESADGGEEQPASRCVLGGGKSD